MTYTVKTLEKLDAEIDAPSSKAHTLRALFLAALADGVSVIQKPLLAEDQHYAIDALKDLGVRVTISDDHVTVEGVNGSFTVAKEEIFVGNSGVSMRLLAALCSLCDKDVTLTGTERMQTGRPIQDLLDALEPLGVKAVSTQGNGCPPIVIPGNSLQGGKTKLKGDKSSQYFSAILLAAPFAQEDVTIETDGELMSKPYVDITTAMMKDFGVSVEHENYKTFFVKAGQQYRAQEYTVEGDFSGASFFFAAAAITGGRIKVMNMDPNSAQGDKVFVDLLEKMGCTVVKGDDFIEVTGGALKGIEADMADYPDIVVPLSVVAAFAEGTSRFYNVAHLRYKESDRLAAPAAELKKMGIETSVDDDSITIVGGTPHGAEIETYKDHRMVMSFAVAGLKVPEMVIKNPENCEKSFPHFFDVLESLY